MVRYHILFKGRVQGVGFRYTSQMIANKLGLTGIVKNLTNGDVEVYVQGAREAISEFINSLKNQSHIKIDSIDKSEVSIKDDEDSFEIVRY